MILKIFKKKIVNMKKKSVVKEMQAIDKNLIISPLLITVKAKLYCQNR
jgi:hypothetical protein